MGIGKFKLVFLWLIGVVRKPWLRAVGRDLQCETGLGLAWEVGVSLEGVLERWSVLTWRFMGSYKWGYK